MAAGLPISLLRKSVYKERPARMRTLYGTDDVAEASRLALAHGVDDIYVDSTGRRAFGVRLDKFDNNPQHFERVFKGGEVSVYRVVPPSEGS